MPFGSRRGEADPGATFILIIIVVVSFLLCSGWYNYGTERETTITIEDKWVTHGGESSTYVIRTDDRREFKVDDTIFHGQFRSSTLYGDLEKGGTYRVRCYGIRQGFGSYYPNIFEIVEVVKKPPTDN